jgi:hypothetical protein
MSERVITEEELWTKLMERGWRVYKEDSPGVIDKEAVDEFARNLLKYTPYSLSGSGKSSGKKVYVREEN